MRRQRRRLTRHERMAKFVRLVLSLAVAPIDRFEPAVIEPSFPCPIYDLTAEPGPCDECNGDPSSIDCRACLNGERETCPCDRCARVTAILQRSEKGLY